MAGMPGTSRSLVLTSGTLLVLLGVWGGLIPFVGPYFHYAYTPDKTWDYTSDRLWLEILPGAGAFVGGLAVLLVRSRAAAALGAAVAAASGAWFALGMTFSPLWNHNVPLGGTPASSTVVMRIAEQVGLFTGLGVVIAALGALALGALLAQSAQEDEAPASRILAADTPTQPIGR
jgi:peptidoglycan/LPS O-acetylase OafA/YrhL